MKSIVDYFSFDQKSKSIMHSIQKFHQALTPNLNDKSGSRKRPMDMFAPTYANLLESRKKGMFWTYGYSDQSHWLNSWFVACETSDNACLEWDRERWNEEKASNGLKKSSCKSKWSLRRSNMQSNMNLKKKSGIVNWNWRKSNAIWISL